MPARPEYAKVLRSIMASVAASLDFSLERIDDLRMAIGEATTQLLEAAPGGSCIRVEADRIEHGLRVELSIDGEHGGWPPSDIEETLAWRVLSTVSEDLELGLDEGRPRMRLLVGASSRDQAS